MKPYSESVMPRWDDGTTLLYTKGTFYVQSTVPRTSWVVIPEEDFRAVEETDNKQEFHRWMVYDLSAYQEVIEDFIRMAQAAGITLDEGYYVMVDKGDSVDFRWEPEWEDTCDGYWTQGRK